MSTWTYPNYPPVWDTGYGEEEQEDSKSKYRCLNHDWVETGLKRSWCKVCDCSAVWTMTGWEEVIEEKQPHSAAAIKSEG
jgi:hypothetical protein